MAAYTIEDVELIRRKSGISYQEAVALLDYHNGNVARALIDLERNGKILPQEETAQRSRPDAEAQKPGLFQRLYRSRFRVSKGDKLVLNVSTLLAIAALVFSPHMVLFCAFLSLIFGYRLSVDTEEANYSSDSLDEMVRSAAQNVRQSVNEMARDFNAAMRDNAAQKPERKAAPDQNADGAARKSYYTANPAMNRPRTGNPSGAAPTMQMPVKVGSRDGQVSIERDDDGYTSATIE